MKKLSLLLIVIVFFVFSGITQAKVLPQAAKIPFKPVSVKSIGTTIGVFPRLRPDRKALNVNFTNLQNAHSVSYALTYKTSTQEEAAVGSLNLNGQTTESAELLFGTCSKTVCRYHTGIKDAKLEVTYTTKSGKKYLKKFKIKI